jgi:hypothetical protein
MGGGRGQPGKRSATAASGIELMIRTGTANFASAAMALTRGAPSVMGIMNSVTTRAGFSSAARSSACWPLVAIRTR